MSCSRVEASVWAALHFSVGLSAADSFRLYCYRATPLLQRHRQASKRHQCRSLDNSGVPGVPRYLCVFCRASGSLLLLCVFVAAGLRSLQSLIHRRSRPVLGCFRKSLSRGVRVVCVLGKERLKYCKWKSKHPTRTTNNPRTSSLSKKEGGAERKSAHA